MAGIVLGWRICKAKRVCSTPRPDRFICFEVLLKCSLLLTPAWAHGQLSKVICVYLCCCLEVYLLFACEPCL